MTAASAGMAGVRRRQVPAQQQGKAVAMQFGVLQFGILQFGVLHVPTHSRAALPSGSLLCPTTAQHVMLCVFHFNLCPGKDLKCLSSVTSPDPELDTSINVLLQLTLPDPDVQEPK